MLTQRPVTTHVTLCVCDRCGREMPNNHSDDEWEEHLTVAFRAGYGSIFGDGNLVECDLCQHCVKALLEKYLRIAQDDPFDPQHKLQHEHHRAYQPYQLREKAQLSVLGEDLERHLQRFGENLKGTPSDS